jgi:acetyl-CoA synthetase (ADP-forming)
MRGIYPVVLDALALDDGVDVIVSRYNLPPSVPMEPIRERLDELNTTRQAHPGKLYPILGRTADQVLPDFWSAARDEGHIVLLGYGRGLQALARLARYSEFLLRPRTDARSQAAGPDLAGLPAGYLDEVAAKRVLAQAGLPMLPAGLATSADEAVVLASDYGYPVVLKVVSPDIVHKSDAGGVRLDLGGEADVRSAFDAIQSATKQIGARFEGVSVQPMIRGGVELALGASRDPQLGPLIMVGVGGILVEAIDDVAFGIAPLGPSEGLQMLDSLRSQRLLDGYRGMPTVDRAAVATAVAQLGFLMLDNPRIESVDINPLVQSNRGLVGLDARVLLGDRRASTA